MLHYLRIENFAIVTQVELHWQLGLTTITGETGAGKSIIIDALELLVGGRADNSMVRQGCSAAFLFAEFAISPKIYKWLHQHDLALADEKHQCQIRRVISTSGRSRAYINDRPVSLYSLKQLGALLLDIHGQHAHQSLLNHDVQRQLLDDMADDQQAIKTVKKAYQQWKQLHDNLQQLGGNAQDREARLSLLRYQVEELSHFELTNTALRTLESEHQRLAHAKQLLQSAHYAQQLLAEDDNNSVLSALNHANNSLTEGLQHDKNLSNIVELLGHAIIQVQEASTELNHYSQQLDADPLLFEQIEQEYSQLRDLARKHHIEYEILPEHYTQLCEQLADLENYEQRAAELEQAIKQAEQQYQSCAEQLHKQRCETAQTLQAGIIKNVQQLGMPHGQLVIDVVMNPHSTPSVLGSDTVTFLVSTNPGHAPRPLHKVVSGGELSRISLAIQVITAQKSGVNTLIFDEVDVGISGGVAEIVGNLLRNLGKKRQILCITHLPQVASQGKQHLQVQKFSDGTTTHSGLVSLNPQQRIEEIARMLGGVEMTAQTLAHAEEMLARNGE